MKKQAGITIMEMMTVIGILAIVGTVATPNAISWLKGAQFSSDVRSVKMIMEDLRLHAVKNCATSIITFNGGNTFQVEKYDRSAGTYVSQTHNLTPGNTASCSSSDDKLRYNSRGMASNCTITIDDNKGKCREIVVSIVGSSRIENCP